jgi:hypothetical protein
MAALRQAWLNSLIDYEFRGQSNTPPASWFVGLVTVLPTRSTAGTELSTGAGFTGYARQEMPCDMTTWSGTQSDGSTTASSGTREYITNNIDVEFSAALAAAWNGIVGFALYDALSAGNQRRFGSIVNSSGTAITISRAIGEPVIFEPGQLRLYLR